MNRTFTKLICAILLGFAVSFTVRNYTLQKELTKLTEDEVRTEWVNAQVELNHVNKNLNVVDNGNAK